MIDRRNISYTEGNYLTPISGGELVVKPPDSTPDVPSGGMISHNRTVPPPRFAIPEMATDLTNIGGAANTVMDLWKLMLGTPEEKVKTVGEFLPIDDTGKKLLEEESKKIGETDWGTQNVFMFPGIEPTPFEFPKIDLSGIGTGLLMAGALLGGLYLAGKYIGRKK